jgi:hypothetical protein
LIIVRNVLSNFNLMGDMTNGNLEADETAFHLNSFYFSLVDMPLSRRQQGTLISTSAHVHNVFLSWLNIQQTITATDPTIIKAKNKEKREKQKERRAKRMSL